MGNVYGFLYLRLNLLLIVCQYVFIVALQPGRGRELNYLNFMLKFYLSVLTKYSAVAQW